MFDQSADDSSKYVDVENGLSRVRGNKSLYKRMLSMFLDSGEFASLEEHLSNNDYEAAGNSAHAIKGITGNLSLTALFEVSTALMGELRNGAPSPETVQLYETALEKTKIAVNETIQQMEV